MIIFYLFVVLIIFIAIKIFLYIMSLKYGKISYDGFNAAGFAYDSEKDLFYSTRDAWQKNFGYGHVYDIGAPIIRIIVDTEPITFNYNNKNWLITFWKGQYGITTGAEIGIYSTDDQIVNKRTIYNPVNPDEMLDMSFKLYKEHELIIDIRSTHWWLAAFKLGMFSNPNELLMDVKLIFPNEKMLQAFLTAFKKKGYKKKNFKVNGNTFSFVYKKPHSRQVYTRTWITDFFTQRRNKSNVKLYNDYAKDIVEADGIDNTLSENSAKLIMLKDLLHDFLKKKQNEIPLKAIHPRINILKEKKLVPVQKETKKMPITAINNDCNVCINIYETSQKKKRCEKHL